MKSPSFLVSDREIPINLTLAMDGKVVNLWGTIRSDAEHKMLWCWVPALSLQPKCTFFHLCFFYSLPSFGGISELQLPLSLPMYSNASVSLYRAHTEPAEQDIVSPAWLFAKNLAQLLVSLSSSNSQPFILFLLLPFLALLLSFFFVILSRLFSRAHFSFLPCSVELVNIYWCCRYCKWMNGSRTGEEGCGRLWENSEWTIRFPLRMEKTQWATDSACQSMLVSFKSTLY